MRERWGREKERGEEKRERVHRERRDRPTFFFEPLVKVAKYKNTNKHDHGAYNKSHGATGNGAAC